MTPDLEAIATAILTELETAWNTADGAAYGRPFAQDADFVTIRGEYYRQAGGTAIGAGPHHIFDTINKGIEIRYELLNARALHEDVFLAHVKATLTAPAGPLAGTHAALPSLVIVNNGTRWEIAALHNTMIAESGG